MNFILKPDLLRISKQKASNHQFYQFQAKQLQQQQHKQYQILQDFLIKIQKQQVEHRQILKKQQKGKKDNKRNNLYYKDNERNSLYYKDEKFNDFYEKNRRWKLNVQADILRQRNQKNIQQQKSFQQNRKPQLQRQSYIDLQNNSSHFNNFSSKGPITGWNQRFLDYIKKKLPQQQLQNSFHPQINSRSKMIARGMIGRVEDRLIKQGEIIKMKRLLTLAQQVQKIGKNPGSSINPVQSPQLFNRLYKQGQKNTFKQKQFQSLHSFSFQPQLNPLSPEMQERIRQKRSKSPLYIGKNLQNIQAKHQLFKEVKKFDKENFQKFIQRNQLMIRKKQENKKIQQKQQSNRIKQQYQKCTFIPILNPKSLRLFQYHQSQILLSQLEGQKLIYEISQIKEQSNKTFRNQPSNQIYKNQSPQVEQKKRNRQRSNNKDNKKSEGIIIKSHQQSQFYMKTPQTKLKSKPLNRPSSVTQSAFALQQASYMDSLQFSYNKIQNCIQNQEQGNQTLNMELTFSNKKLLNQLQDIAQINTIKQLQDITQVNATKQLQDITKVNKIKQSKKSTSNWQHELQKMSNKVKELMKPARKSMLFK